MNVQQTLAELVAINSVSTNSNFEIIEYLEHRCQKLNLSTRRWSYVDEFGLEKINLVATSTETHTVELALVGHTDTVPFDLAWNEATTLVEGNGKLFARGACDTKGFIAAALTAVESIDLGSLKLPLALIFTSDEEVGLRGAKYLAEQKAIKPRYCIIGEPTSLRPIRAGKGYCLAEVILRGKEAHSAYPALGASAVLRAARLITRLDRIGERLKDERHEDFDPPFTTFNVGLIRGGSAKNVIAGECRFTLEWRPVPTQDPSRVLELLNEAIAEEKKLDPDFDCHIGAGRSDSGFETAPEARVIQLLEAASGNAAGTVAFGTEAAHMRSLGAESVVIGPGDIREAHRTGEFVPVDELNRCTEILKRAVLELCG